MELVEGSRNHLDTTRLVRLGIDRLLSNAAG
jgi:hypothetical protein